VTETEAEIQAVEPEGSFMKRRTRYIKIVRSTDTITDIQLRRLHEKVKNSLKNVSVLVLSAGDFSQSAIEYSNKWPIDLYGKSKLIEILNKI
jgi:hypothetical protein